MSRFISIEPSVCTGCQTCEVACSLFHFGECNPFRSAVHVIRREKGGLVTSLPLVCQQCSHAPCIEACPTEALFRVGKDSPLIIDEANCTACGNCVDACPAGCITLDEKTHIPLVCDLCGGDPQCVILCHSHCLTIGDDMGADNTYRIERLAALLDAEDLIMKRAPEGDR